MNQWQSGGNTPPPADHIYVNGYGFVSEDPWLQENRNIWKAAIYIGVILLGILVVPSMLVYPVQVVLNLFFTPLLYLASGTYLVAELQVLYSQLMELFLYAGSILLPLAFAAVVLRPKQKQRQGIFHTPSSRFLGSCIASSMAVWVIFYLGSQTLSNLMLEARVLPLAPDKSIPTGIAAVCIYVLRVVCLPALLEEILFRGYILRSLRQFGDSFAIVVSSAAFGLIHFTITQDIRNFALGLILAYFVIRSGSLWTAIIARFSCLLLGLATDCLPHIFPSSVAQLAQNLFFLAILAIGLLSFIQFCRMEKNPFVLSNGHTATRISHKLTRFFGNIVMVAAILLWLLQALSYLQFIG